MPFSGTSYDPETLVLLESAFNEAWAEVQMACPSLHDEASARLRRLMALRIMNAADDGVRDPRRLKLLAIQAIESRQLN